MPFHIQCSSDPTLCLLSSSGVSLLFSCWACSPDADRTHSLVLCDFCSDSQSSEKPPQTIPSKRADLILSSQLSSFVFMVCITACDCHTYCFVCVKWSEYVAYNRCPVNVFLKESVFLSQFASWFRLRDSNSASVGRQVSGSQRLAVAANLWTD